MDRFASNTLRTLGIIATAIFVIIGCLVIFLLALCFGMIAKSGGPATQASASAAIVGGAIIAALALIAGGVAVIGVLARGMIRGPSQPAAPGLLIPPSATIRPDPAPALEPSELVSSQTRLDQTVPPILGPPSHSASAPLSIDVRHLSPASRTAIHQLAYAIVAKVAAEIVLGIVGWYGALGMPHRVRAPFPVYHFGFIVWGLAAIAPHLVLLYALARRPGPRAFSYALVIPSLHLLFGFFGHSAFLAFALRAGQSLAPLLSIFPWLIDILILYLAWKAIRLTGIEPSPERLIIASVVIFLYSSILPILVIYLNTLAPPGLRRFP